MDHKDQTESITLYTRLLDAWNRRSADDFAALFTEDANTVGFDGSMMDGRSVIAASLREIFANHPTAAYVAKVREARRLGEDVRLLRAVVGMVPPGQAELNPAVNAIHSVVIVGKSGQLRIALLHNTPAAFHGRPHLAKELTDELTSVLRSGESVHA